MVNRDIVLFMTDDKNKPNKGGRVFDPNKEKRVFDPNKEKRVFDPNKEKRVFDTTKPLNNEGTWRPKQSQARNRSNKTRPLADYVDGVTKQVLGKRGFTNSRIVTDWRMIVGEYLAEQCTPEGIHYRRGEKTGGVLHIHAYGVQAMELEYLKGQVIEQVNMHMGYAAVGDIKIIQITAPNFPQNPPPNPTAPERPIGTKNPPRPLTQDEQQSLTDSLADIEDDELKAILERLGKSVIGDTGSRQ